MKLSIKSISLKVLALVLAVCAGVAVYSFANANGVVKADEPVASFALTEGASIRDAKDEETGETYFGLGFETTVNTQWLTENNASRYSFGTLIFPTVLNDRVNTFSTDKSVATNANENFAVNFNATDYAHATAGFTYRSTIVFDRKYITDLIKVVYGKENPTEDEIDIVLENLYAMEMTAVSYVQYKDAEGNDVLVYTNAYATSMLKVAIRLASDETWGEKAKDYIKGEVTFGDAYVSAEDNVLVVDGYKDFDASKYETVIVGNTNLVSGSGYSFVEGALVLNASIVSANLGSYAELYFVDDESGDVVVLNVLYVNKALKTAQEVEQAFDYGDQIVGEHFGKNDKSYVLANDIDMTGVTMSNRMISAGNTITTYVDDGNGGYTIDKVTSVASDYGFAGIFDGRGYAISNVTVSLVNWSLGQHVVDETGKKSWINGQAQGFFASVRPEGEIRNVAFINVYGDGAINQNFGINGLLGNAMNGTLENVYFEASVNTLSARGPFANYSNDAVVKNVVVNFPKPEGYTIESGLELAAKPTGGYYDIYAYGYGAMSGATSPLNRNTDYENVIVVSPMPINLYKNAGSGYAGITNVTYAENETDLRVLFDYAEGTTIAEAIEAEKGLAANYKKTYQIAGIRRYDNLYSAAADTNYVQKLVDTGYFKIAEDQVIWHNQRAYVTVDEPVEYDDAEGKFITTSLSDKEITGVSVDGVKLVPNVDYTIVDGEINFVNVPDKTNQTHASQITVFEFETKDVVYVYDNVTYWTSIIDTATELKEALDISYEVITGVQGTTNYGFFKLSRDIDMEGVKFNYTGYTSTVKNQNYETGFAGVFDGCGHAIMNANPGRYGLFGNFTIGGSNYPMEATVVRNLAVTNFTCESSTAANSFGSVFGRYANCNGKTILFENIYVSYADNSPVNGLLAFANKVTMNNVLVDTNGNTVAPGNVLAGAEYGPAVAGKAIAWNNSEYNDGGALFPNTRFFTPSGVTTANINNVVTFGKVPVIYQWAYSSNYNNFWVYDETNGWAKRNSGTLEPYTPSETYYGFAGNQQYGDIPMMTGMKAGFATLVNENMSKITIASNKSPSNAFPGYVCTTCGETFSLNAGTCDKCSVALSYFANLWTTPWSFTWELLDVQAHENTIENSVYKNGTYVLAGVSKYSTASEMSSAYTANKDVFASFINEETGNGMWKISDTGVLMWHDDDVNHDCAFSEPTCTAPATCEFCGKTEGEPLGHNFVGDWASNNDGTHYKVCSRDDSHILTEDCSYDLEIVSEETLKEEGGIAKHPVYYKSCECGHVSDTETFEDKDAVIVIDTAMDYDASSGQLFTILLSGIGVDSATLDGNALTLSIDNDKNVYLFKDAPVYNNHYNYQNVIIRVVSGEYTYDFTNVTYWTMIINDGAELKAALDIDYSVAPHNYGFYKLGNDIVIDKNNPITFDYVGYSTVIKNRFSAGGFAGVFDGAGHTIDFNKTWLGSTARSNGLFGNFNTGGGTADITMGDIIVRDLAIVNVSVGGAPSTLLLGKYGKNHHTAGHKSVVIENLYVNSFGDVPGGLFNDIGTDVKLNNVFIDLDGQNSNTGYASAVLTQILRTTDSYLETNITNFVTLGNSLKTNLAGSARRAPAASAYYKTIKSTANGDGTYTHKATHGGWGTGNTYGAEYYYAYAGGNQEYGNIELVQGLKPEFAEIAKTVANSSTAIAGYYCATCGDTFSKEAGTCAKCSVDLTYNANLWSVAQAYVLGYTKLSEVDNSLVHSGANGELVLPGAYAYYSATEMRDAGLANAFESFTGEAGNGYWTVYGDGMLKWHSVEYKHTCTGAPATCEESSVCTICGEEIAAALGHEYSDNLISFNDGNHRRVCTRDPNHVLEEQCTYDRYIESEDYLVSEATIGQNAIYKVSCACGHGSQTDTFEAASADLTFDYVVDYDVFTGALMSTALSDVVIDKVLVGNIELNVGNGGLSFDSDMKLHILTPNDKDNSLTNAVPYMNNLISASNVITVTVYSSNAIYRFTNVEYSTMVIHSASQLKIALDYDYSKENKNNFGFYKLGNSIDIGDDWTKFDYSDLKSAVSAWNGLSADAGFAGIFDGNGYTIDFNNKGAGDFGIFGAFGTGAQVYIKKPATVKNLAIVEYQNNWKPVLAQFSTIHTYNNGALFENLYVTWGVEAVQSGLILESNGKTKYNNIVVNIENNKQYGSPYAEYASKAVYGDEITDKTLHVGDYYGATLIYNLRRGSALMDEQVTNFISLGKGGLSKYYSHGSDLRYYFYSVDNGNGTYTHTVRNGGWSGTPLYTSAMYAYAGNQEYGDQPIPTGMKPGFAAIANTHPGTIGKVTTINNVYTTAIPGYYCAVCGDTFSLTEGTCCETALTYAADLWKQPIAFTWKSTKLSEVDNSKVATTGEMVFHGASKYDNTAEMQDAYATDNTIFDSFTGETGNGLWTVVDGKLTWVGSKVSHVHTWKDATCTEAKVCVLCGDVEGEPLGHDGVGTNCDRCGIHIRDYALLFAVSNGEATLTGFEGVANELELPSTYNGNNVTAIGDNAFSNCTSLTSIVIPGTVTSIGDNAFFGCTALEAVYYGNTADQWALVSIGSGNEAFVGLGCYVENQYSSVAFFGDSITQGYGDNCQLTDNNYVNELTEMMDLDVSINNGLSSTTFCVSSLSGSVYDRFKYSSKFEQNGEAVEVVLIMAGVNDFNRATETHYGLGTFLCDDNKTIYGSAKTWCEKILEYKSMAKYANTRFIICTPTITSWNDSMGSRGDYSPTVTNLQGITLRQMCEAMIETCEYYGVEVFDMNIESGIYWNSAEDNTVDIYFGDGIHPGDAGHYQIATVLYNHLKYTYVEA